MRSAQVSVLFEEREALLDILVTAYLEKPEPIRGLSGDDVTTLYHGIA
jgi:hypothetical protein